jgi:hypothetical protein
MPPTSMSMVLNLLIHKKKFLTHNQPQINKAKIASLASINALELKHFMDVPICSVGEYNDRVI